MRFNTVTSNVVAPVLPWLGRLSGLMVAIGLLASSGAAQTVEPVVSLDLPTTERLSAPQSPPGERAADRATTARGGLWGYVFAGPGVYRNEVTIDRGRFRGKHTAFDVVQETYRSGSYGGGVEWQVFKSVGVSGEVGTQIVSGYPHGMLSANVSYRFRSAPPEQPTLVPFVTGGYSLVDAPGVNIGVGVDQWLRGGRGLRLEFRATRLRQERRLDFVPHAWLLDFRVGWNFGRQWGR